MNSNSNIIPNSMFSPQSNLYPQTSTFFSSAIKHNYQSNPNHQEIHHDFTEPSQSPHINNRTPSSSARSFNFEASMNANNNTHPKRLDFMNPTQNLSQTTNYILEKLKNDTNMLMDVEVSDFTVEYKKPEDFIERHDDFSHFDNLIQNIEVPIKSSGEIQNKAIVKERYPQPKRKNPTLIK